jgi:hypothetical protein
MKLLQEIHKLAARKNRGTHNFITTIQDFEMPGYYVPDFDVQVTFDYTPEDYTQHVPGDPTTRERHPADVEIISAHLLSGLNVYDEEGEHVLKAYHEGLPVEELPGWDQKWESKLEDEAFDNLPDEPDYDDRDSGF